MDSLELARSADGGAAGAGAPVQVDADAVARALADLLRAATRHGGVRACGGGRRARASRFTPVPAEAAPIVLGEEAKDLGALVAVLVVRALGGDVGYEADALWVRLPA